MKRTVIVLLLALTGMICFAQSKTFYFDGISFEHHKSWEFSQTKENSTTNISSSNTKESTSGLFKIGIPSNVIITKSKVKEDLYIDIEGVVEQWADEMKEHCLKNKLSPRHKNSITDETIGANIIEAKFIDCHCYDKWGKLGVFERLYAFEQADYIITILVRGIIDAKIKMILNSFWFMPETNADAIIIPDQEEQSTESSTSRITVRKGDTLGSLAKKHNTTVKEIKKLNNLKSDFLRVGQKLRVR